MAALLAAQVLSSCNSNDFGYDTTLNKINCGPYIGAANVLPGNSLKQ
ncbi:hypothetical protein yberc0001_8910 [Yersinia bercovieri ATCC 43970]|uniref:Lipoprotein n=1 Tax=Yersinia bercovieri ATCC 43970 TaxID=349968 RepID=A0ABM9Y1N8_YERBE|nr:hypothetical protein yberc0001_8910 [Yersinia bercovieri ATCC 43970]